MPSNEADSTKTKTSTRPVASNTSTDLPPTRLKASNSGSSPLVTTVKNQVALFLSMISPLLPRTHPKYLLLVTFAPRAVSLKHTRPPWKMKRLRPHSNHLLLVTFAPRAVSLKHTRTPWKKKMRRPQLLWTTVRGWPRLR